MAHDDTSTVENLGHRPEQMNWMIPVRRQTPPAPLEHLEDDSKFGLGRLDTLPIEILDHVLEELDFNSLGRLAHTSRAAYRYINSYPAYQEVRTYAPETIRALHDTELSDIHPVSRIYRTLLSSICACCGRFGAFLFLITCQRSCYQCLRGCRKFQLITTEEAPPMGPPASCHGSATLELRRLRVVPGRYRSGMYSNTRLDGQQLVSLDQAVSLSKQPQICDASKMDIDRDAEEEMLDRSTHIDRSEYTDRCTAGTDASDTWPLNTFIGMGAVPFPHLDRRKQKDYGTWCRGCWQVGQAKLIRRYKLEKVSVGDDRKRGLDERDVRMRIIDMDTQEIEDTDELIRRLQQQERSRAEFVEHVNVCPCLDLIWNWNETSLMSLRDWLVWQDHR